MPYTLQSDVEIVNRALQILGDKRIVSLDDGSNAAKEMSSTFDLVRDCLIRSKNWLCCQKEATVALTGIDETARLKNEFALPADCLRVIRVGDDYIAYSGASGQYGYVNPWVVRGTRLYTNFSAPLKLVYAYRNRDVKTYDPLFIEALACEMALALCKRLTDSASLEDMVRRRLREIMADALHSNALERPATTMADGNWIAAKEGELWTDVV